MTPFCCVNMHGEWVLHLAITKPEPPKCVHVCTHKLGGYFWPSNDG